MSKIKIEYFSRDHFGTTRFYALDPEQAQSLEEATGNKSITPKAAKALRELGVEFVKVPDPYVGLSKRKDTL